MTQVGRHEQGFRVIAVIGPTYNSHDARSLDPYMARSDVCSIPITCTEDDAISHEDYLIDSNPGDWPDSTGSEDYGIASFRICKKHHTEHGMKPYFLVRFPQERSGELDDANRRIDVGRKKAIEFFEEGDFDRALMAERVMHTLSKLYLTTGIAREMTSRMETAHGDILNRYPALVDQETITYLVVLDLACRDLPKRWEEAGVDVETHFAYPEVLPCIDQRIIEKSNIYPVGREHITPTTRDTNHADFGRILFRNGLLDRVVGDPSRYSNGMPFVVYTAADIIASEIPLDYIREFSRSIGRVNPDRIPDEVITRTTPAKYINAMNKLWEAAVTSLGFPFPNKPKNLVDILKRKYTVEDTRKILRQAGLLA